MILAADIGNTNLAIGIFDSGNLVYKTSLPDNIDWLSGEWTRAILSALEGIDIGNIEGAVLASVVPCLTDGICSAIGNIIKGKILKADIGKLKTLESEKYDLNKLGADRMADILAAVKIYGAPAAVFDLGTATTLSAADKEEKFIGGMIIPGVRLSVDSLSSRAALLPFIELRKPESLLGTDTASCMVNGAVYGAAAVIDGVSEELRKELGRDINIIITGGAAELVVPLCKNKYIYDRDLLLKGLMIMYEINK